MSLGTLSVSISKSQNTVEIAGQTPSVSVSAGANVEISGIGVQGPRGPTGESVQTISATVGEAIGGHRAVSVIDGVAYITDPQIAESALNFVGISTSAAVLGAQVDIQTAGKLIEPSWNFTPGPLFVGILGVLTQVQPATGAVIYVGAAIDTDTIAISPSPPIFQGTQMADKPIQLVNGRLTQVEATVSSSGVSNAGDLVALDSTGKLDTTVLPVGVGADTKSITASENLSAGDFVNIWNDTGAIKARKADATTAGKEAVGFVLAAVTSGESALVYLEGTNTQLSSLTLGARYYLATTAGQATATPPSAAGNVVQYLGLAISATEISFEPSDGVIIA